MAVRRVLALLPDRVPGAGVVAAPNNKKSRPCGSLAAKPGRDCNAEARVKNVRGELNEGDHGRSPYRGSFLISNRVDSDFPLNPSLCAVSEPDDSLPRAQFEDTEEPADHPRDSAAGGQ